MTSGVRFERVLEDWLASAAPAVSPAALHDMAMQPIEGSRQRPGWLVSLRGDTFDPVRAPGPSTTFGVATWVGLLLLTLLAGILVVAAVLRPDTDTSDRNGTIAFSVFENRQRDGQTSLTYLMDPGGSQRRLLAQGTCPTFSSDGRVLAYRSDWAGVELLVGRADGSTASTLPISLDVARRDHSWALSPDGTRVAWFKRLDDVVLDDGSVTAQNELWVTPVAGGMGIRILQRSQDPGEAYLSPTWAPDASAIAFVGIAPSTFTDVPSVRSGVYVIRPDGSDLRRLTTRPATGHGALSLSWSSDSRSLAYVGLPDGQPLPTISTPDALATDPPLDVFVVSADGTGERNVTASHTFEASPTWSPTGSSLAYLRSDDGETYRLIIGTIDGSSSSGPLREGPAARAFAWAPDLKTLLIVQDETLRSIAANLEGSPLLLADLPTWPQRDPDREASYGLEGECPPSWQRLDP